MSVLLLSNGPLQQLPPGPVAVTGNSDTSITLLEILLRESLGRANPLVRTELPAREALRRYPAHLVIGTRRSGRSSTAWRRTSPISGNGGDARRETVRLRPLDRHPERVERAQGSPVPVLRRPPCGETGRAGVRFAGGNTPGEAPTGSPPPSGRPTGAASPTTSTRRRRVFPCSTGWRRRSAGSPRRRLSASSKPARGSPW